MEYLIEKFRQTKGVIASLLIAVLLMQSGYYLPEVYAQFFAAGDGSESLEEGLEFSDAPKDWSTINWEDEVVLLEDFDGYLNELDEKEDNGEDLSEAKVVTKKMWDEDVMNYYDVPQEVQFLVNDYKSKIELIDVSTFPHEEASLKRLLSNDIKLVTGFEGPENEEQLVLDINDLPKLDITKEIDAVEEGDKTQFNKLEILEKGYEGKFPNTIRDYVPEKDASGAADVSYSLGGIFGVQTVYADDPTFIEWYEGIEEFPVDLALLYLSDSMNEDGSLGFFNMLVNTADLATLLSHFGLTQNDDFTAMISYFRNYEPVNYREKAVQARILAGIGDPVDTLIDELIVVRNGDGGLGIDEFYESDVDTTVEFVRALLAAERPLSDVNPSLFYLVSRIDNEGAIYYNEGANPAYFLMNKTAQVLQYFEGTFLDNGQIQISIDDKINDILDHFEDNYSTEEGRLLGAADLTDEIMMYFTFYENDFRQDIREQVMNKMIELQESNGSFENDMKGTIESLKVLAGPDLELISITPLSQLVNDSEQTFVVSIKNNGYLAVRQGILYFMVDNFEASITTSCAEHNIVINPGSTVNFELTIPSRSYYLDETNIKFYMDNPGDMDYDDNWADIDLTYQANNNEPARHVYYIAQQYYSSNLGTGFNVRWALKDDPNRLNHVIAFREQGTNDWSYSGIRDDWNGAFIAGFPDDTVYEVTSAVLHNDGNTVTRALPTTIVRTVNNDDENRSEARGYVTDGNNRTEDLYVRGYSVSDHSDENGDLILDDAPNGNTAAWVDEDAYEPIVTKFPTVANSTTTGVRFFTRLIEDDEAPTVSLFELRFENDFRFYNQNDEQILLIADDNIDLKDGDFYLYDPNDESWHFMYHDEFDGGNQLFFDWDVPDTVLGTGYKLGAIVRDFRGNESEFVEWGPFEVFDGSAPEFTVTSPVEGDEFNLGETMPITWDTVSAHPISRVRVYLEYPNGDRDIINSANVEGVDSYEIPVKSAYAGDEVQVRIRGWDSENNREAEAYSGTFRIVDNSPNPNDIWSRPELLTDIVSFDDLGCSVRDYYMAQGVNSLHYMVHCVDEEYVGDDRIITNTMHHYTLDADRVLSAPVLAYEKVDITDGNLNGYTPPRDISFIVDNDNHGHLMWTETAGCETYNDADILYSYFDGNEWTQTVNVSDGDTRARSAHFVSDYNNRVHLAWIDGRTYEENCSSTGSNRMKYAVKDGGNWSSPEQITIVDSIGYPVLATDSNDKPHIYFRDYTNSGFSKVDKTGGSWANFEMFFSSDNGNWVDHADLDFANHEHLVIGEYFNDPDVGYHGRIMYLYNDGNGWDIKEVTPRVNENFVDPAFVLDPERRPHIVYRRDVSSPANDSLEWITRRDDGNFAIKEQLSLDAQYVNSPDPSLGILGDKLFAVYNSSFAQMGQNFYTEAEFSAIDYSTPPPVIESFTLEKDSVVADSQDEQVMRYVVQNGEQVNTVMFLCNHTWHRVADDAPKCGYFRWEEGVGFTEYIAGYNTDVELLDTSERIVHEDGRVEFVLRFRYLSGFTGYVENVFSAITYWDGGSQTWTPSDDHFEISRDPNAEIDPTIESFTIEKPTVVADSQEEQVMRYILNDGEQVNAVMFLCNHPWHRVDVDAPFCGYFRWEEGVGFTEYTATYNQHVELLDTSERIVHEDGRVEFVLRFSFDSGFEGYSENVFSAITYWDGGIQTWTPSEDHFEITMDEGFVPDPTLSSFTLDEDSVVANSQDEQVMRYVVANGESVHTAMFLCNHTWHRVSIDAPYCGFFRWTEESGFTEYIASYNQHVELLDTSERVVNEDGSVEFILRFRFDSGWEGYPDNVFSGYSAWDTGYKTWTASGDHFAIVPE